MSSRNSVDVFGNMRRIDNRKADIILGVGKLYKILSAGNDVNDEEIGDCLAGIIASTISLGDCLGVHYGDIEGKIISKLRMQLLEK
jgi:hypothetical protein